MSIFTTSFRSRNEHVLGPVAPGIRQSISAAGSEKEYSVVGDGRFESFMLDGFRGESVIESLEDPRIASFVAANRKGWASVEERTESVKTIFGPEWEFRSVNNGHGRSAVFQKDGYAQEVTLSNLQGPEPDIAVGASIDRDNEVVSQTLSKSHNRDGLQPIVTEALAWQPSKAVVESDLAHLEILLGSDPWAL